MTFDILLAAAIFSFAGSMTPGPNNFMLLASGVNFGFRRTIPHMAGILVGMMTLMLAVGFGLGSLLNAYPSLHLALKIIGAAYLLYLAAKIAFAGSSIAFIHSQRPPGFAGGLALQAANPKAYVVNTALMTGFPFLPSSLAWELALKFAIMNAIWVPIHLLWLYAGTVLYRLDLSPRAHFAINVAMALAMIAVVALAAWSTLCRATPAS